jgi:phosphoribosylglycinamide formyltransferase-1
MTNITIFASGSGSNAENIFNYFKGNNEIRISSIITNNKNAFVIERAQKLNIPCEIISKLEFQNSEYVLNILKKYNSDFIVLAGFLLLIPEYLISEFQKKIINIHPALLPKYGGKGMYGDNVHKSVIENNETESGITVHFVNQKYDEGKIIFQKKCTITPSDTAETLANKIHELEYNYFPKTIEKIISDAQKIKNE